MAPHDPTIGYGLAKRLVQGNQKQRLFWHWILTLLCSEPINLENTSALIQPFILPCLTSLSEEEKERDGGKVDPSSASLSIFSI